jgi:hypothetical protein
MNLVMTHRGLQVETAVPDEEIPDEFTFQGVRYVRESMCSFVDDSNGVLPPKCSACGYEPSIYECSWLIDGGYEFEGSYCPNCGRKVRK